MLCLYPYAEIKLLKVSMLLHSSRLEWLDEVVAGGYLHVLTYLASFLCYHGQPKYVFAYLAGEMGQWHHSKSNLRQAISHSSEASMDGWLTGLLKVVWSLCWCYRCPTQLFTAACCGPVVWQSGTVESIPINEMYVWSHMLPWHESIYLTSQKWKCS